jgi:hypothetical protein
VSSKPWHEDFVEGGGGHAAAIAVAERSVIYTLLGSCRPHVINPFDYLKDLFTRLPAAKIAEIHQFTPAGWATARSTKILPSVA